MKKLAAAGAGFFAFEKVVGYLGDATQAASDLQQTTMKSNVIFGRQAAAVEKWASTSVDSFGLSKTAALDAASGFGDMLLQLGDTDEQAAKTSESIVQMAADLGSFNNLETGDVLDRISASLRGEFDSLQALIPNINAARVEQEALAQTGKKAASELTAQEKAHATLAIIQRDGARAQGDFARSSGTLAIEQQKAAAKAEELQAKIGEKLLPIMTSLSTFASSTALPALSRLVDVVADFASGVAAVPGPIKALVGALIAVKLLKGPLVSMFDTLRLKAMYAGDAMRGAGTGAGAMSRAGKGLSGVFGGLGGVIFTAAAVGLAAWIDRSGEADRAGQQLADTLDKQTGAFTDLTREMVKNQLLEKFSGKDFAELGPQLDKAGVGIAGFIDAYRKGGPAIDEFKAKFDAWQASAKAGTFDPDEIARLDALGNTYHDVGAGLDVMRVGADVTRGAMDQLADSTTDAADAAPPLGSGLAGVLGVTKDLNFGVAELNGLMDEFYGRNLDASEAAIAYEDSLAAATASLKENGKTLDLHSEKGRKNQSALNQLAQSAARQAKATLEAGGSTATAGAQMDAARERFIKLATQMNGGNRKAAEEMATKFGLTRTRVAELSASINGVPAAKASTITVRTAQAASAVADIKAELAALPRTKDVLIRVRTLQNELRLDANGVKLRTGGDIPGYATGTLVGPGTGTSDSIGAFVAETGRLLRLSTGEFVSTDASRRRNHAALEAGNRGATLEVAGSGRASAAGLLTAADVEAIAQALAAAVEAGAARGTSAGLGHQAREIARGGR